MQFAVWHRTQCGLSQYDGDLRNVMPDLVFNLFNLLIKILIETRKLQDSGEKIIKTTVYIQTVFHVKLDWCTIFETLPPGN